MSREERRRMEKRRVEKEMSSILTASPQRPPKPSDCCAAASKTGSSVGSAQAAQCLPASAAAEPVKKATEQLPGPSKPAASSLRARRGLPELSCKCPQQNPLVAAPTKKQPAKIPLLTPILRR